MEYRPTAIPEVMLLIPKVHADERGFFQETYRQDEFNALCCERNFVQDNHSRSKAGTLRGLHYQIQQSQGKLIRAVVGEIFDVAVDLRQGSPSFGHWVGARLSAQNAHQLWVPEGFAHGFYVLSDWAEVFYKATDYYAPQWERNLRWNDPSVGIEWPLLDGQLPTLSAKDAIAPLLAQADIFSTNR